MIRFAMLVGALVVLGTSAFAQTASHGDLDGLIATHAAANGVPEALVRRVIMRESGYNARLIGRGGATGLMQIKLATARGMGYTGSAAGLLDPDTNMTYAVKYLAGAYHAAGGSHDRAVSLYARGYYNEAKRERSRERMAGATPAATSFGTPPLTSSSFVAFAEPPRRHRRAARVPQNPLAALFSIASSRAH